MNRLIRVYAAPLRFAERPHHFRAEFDNEMQSVFADIMAGLQHGARLRW